MIWTQVSSFLGRYSYSDRKSRAFRGSTAEVPIGVMLGLYRENGKETETTIWGLVFRVGVIALL